MPKTTKQALAEIECDLKGAWTVEQFADLLGVARRTARDIVLRDVRHYRIGRRRLIKIPKSAVSEYLRGAKVEPKGRENA